MVNREKVEQKRVLRFKKLHFSNLVRELFTVKQRKDGETYYEDIILDGKVRGTFTFSNGVITFSKPEEVITDASEGRLQPEGNK